MASVINNLFVVFQTMVRIWDTFLYEGNKVLFRFALAFFKMSESQLLKLHDYIQIFNFLRKMPSRMKDVQRLSQVSHLGSWL